MKKIIFFIATFIFILLSPFNITEVHASESKTYYAKVLNNSTYFYASPSLQTGEQLFVIPSSYFVLLIDDADEDFYHAKYKDLYGYVKKNDVTPMDGTPLNPYANSSFRVFSQNGLSLMAKPQKNAQVLGTLQFLQEGIPLYGEIIGEELFENSTSTWYYCSSIVNGNSVTGYAFSYYCDLINKAGENTEYFPQITGKLDFSNPISSGGGLSDTVKAIIILAVSLPCLVVLYLLLSPHKHKLPKSKTKVKTASRGKDYYEFNEDDLN